VKIKRLSRFLHLSEKEKADIQLSRTIDAVIKVLLKKRFDPYDPYD
jgi:hypothetical protein